MTQPQPWRMVIVDDEPPARQSLRVLLDRHPEFQIVAECGHGAEAIAAVRTHAPHVLFLDVQMPGLDGFEVLEEIGPDAVPALVFATAYDAYALRAFERHALEYLLKPFSDERFHAVIAHVEARLREHTLATSGEHLAALLASRRRDSLVLRTARLSSACPASARSNRSPPAISGSHSTTAPSCASAGRSGRSWKRGSTPNSQLPNSKPNNGAS
jgi:DNA-binding LytR/AlgR family response regulator